MEPAGKVTCQGNHKGRKERVGLVLGIGVGKRQLFHGLRYVPRIITEEKRKIGAFVIANYTHMETMIKKTDI